MTGHPSRPATLAEAPAVGGTPVRPVRVPLPGRSVRLWLKLEAENSFGSVKARTAAALLDRLEETGRLGPGRRVVESTSGNLGSPWPGSAAPGATPARWWWRSPRRVPAWTAWWPTAPRS
ncbi:pyridoxal-phosphate dependent enzyme [Streptomyces sp. AD16]|nr:pyridoxal-phosphate dependent enzyme [Streptomyces sp. AD16]